MSRNTIKKTLLSLDYCETGVNLIPSRDYGVRINAGRFQGLLGSDVFNDKKLANEKDFIACTACTPNGTEEEAVKLFLKLAQMTDDNADSLPVLFKGEVYDSWMSVSYETEDDFKSIKTLSPFEVAQAFKDGRIEL
ncbi:MAG: hypothetical protein SNG27_07720 [Rikenellaceae bacterium]